MKYSLHYIQNILSTQNYLEFDKILTAMQEGFDSGEEIQILDKDGNTSIVIKNFDELEFFKKRMIQIYGIYGYF